MSSNENIDTFTKWIEAHRAHDLDTLVTFLTDDVTIQSAAGADMPPAKGKVEARHHWQTIYQTFPDFRMDAVDLTSQGAPCSPRSPTAAPWKVPWARRSQLGAATALKAHFDSTSPKERSSRSSPIGTRPPSPNKSG